MHDIRFGDIHADTIPAWQIIHRITDGQWCWLSRCGFPDHAYTVCSSMFAYQGISRANWKHPFLIFNLQTSVGRRSVLFGVFIYTYKNVPHQITTSGS